MEIYTDGSCIIGPDNLRYGGAGVWFGPNDPRNSSIPIDSEFSTNQYAELLAIRYGLLLCRNVSSLVLYSDSKYSISCVTVWYKNWRQNGWKTSTNKDVMHSAIIRECVEILEYRQIKQYSTQLKYVKGHSGILGNVGADELAGQASSKSCQTAMDKWRGENLLGKALMVVRDEMHHED
jgi:ribonuclease HI